MVVKRVPGSASAWIQDHRGSARLDDGSGDVGHDGCSEGKERQDVEDHR